MADVKLFLSADIKDQTIDGLKRKLETKLVPNINVNLNIDNLQKQIQSQLDTAFGKGTTNSQSNSSLGKNNSSKNAEKDLDVQLRISRALEKDIKRTQNLLDNLRFKYKEALKTTRSGYLKDSVEDIDKIAKDLQKVADQKEKADAAFADNGDLNAYKDATKGITLSTRDYKEQIQDTNAEIRNAKNLHKDFGKTLLANMKQFASWTTATLIVKKLWETIKKMIQEVIKLDKVFTNIQMVTGYTNQQMEELKNTYISMAKALSSTVDEVANAANDWLRMGLSVSETNKALESAIILAKVAGVETSKATTMLISVMKGYKLEAQDLISVVDKLSAVDMKSASSSEDLAEAISKVASVAYAAGITLDKLVAYAATIKDVTQQSAESVGTALNSILSRMTKVAAGLDLDDFGESINDVDKVLSKYGITLRNAFGDMNDIEGIIDDLAKKWRTLTTAEQNQIATALGGTRQRNAVVTLLNNYDEVLKLTEESLNSTGTAEKKFGTYTDSVEAKVNKLKSSFQELAETTINSGFVKALIDVGTVLLNIQNYLGGIVPLLGTIVSTILIIKGIKIAKEIYGIATAANVLKGTLQGALGVIGLIVAAIMTVYSIVKSVINGTKQKQEEEIKSLRELQEEIKNTREEIVKLQASEEKGAEQKLAEKWKELTKQAKLLRVEIKGLSGSYEDYLKLSGDVEKKALSQELEKTKDSYTSAKSALSSTVWASFGSNISGKYKTASYEERIKEVSDLIDQMETGELDHVYWKGMRWDISKAKEYYQQLVSTAQQYQDTINEYEVKQAELTNFDKIQGIKDAYAKISSLDKKEAKESAKNILEEIDDLTIQVQQNYSGEIADALLNQFDEVKEALNNIIDEDLVSKFINIQIQNVRALQEAEEEENEALERKLTLQEKILAVQEAQEKLAQAKQKRARVYRAGRGFVYEEDFSALSEAQKNLSSAQKSLREYQSSVKYEEEISLLQKTQDEWERLFKNDENFKDFVNGLNVTMDELGETTEGILNWMSGVIRRFKEEQGVASTQDTSESWDYFGNLNTSGITNIGSDSYKYTGQSSGTNLSSVTYTNSNGSSIYISNLSLPNVTDAQSLVEELNSIGRTSLQAGVTHN